MIIFRKSKNAKINATISLSGDKSISHRFAIFSLLSCDVSRAENFLFSSDCLCSLKIAKKLGAKIWREGKNLCIKPPKVLSEPNSILDCKNSGTSMRVFCGLLASAKGQFILSGDQYLNTRPMARIIKPLRKIGADIKGRADNFAPIVIFGKPLRSYNYKSKISSAQVKTCLILAGLFANKPSFFSENFPSRDHSERMLKKMGASLEEKNGKIKIEPLKKPLKPLNIKIPSDPSSAFFFAVLAAINPNAKINFKNLSLNKTRIEAFKILEKMGAKITYKLKENAYEPIGDICVEGNKLKAVSVEKNISWLIDEIPALSIAFAFAEGKSSIKNAAELRVKESDRIKAIVSNLNLCNIKAKENGDGFWVKGGKILPAKIKTFGDHRIAMSFAIAGFYTPDLKIDDQASVKVSFPDFFKILASLGAVWK